MEERVELKPYYEDETTTIYLGDCRDVLPSLSFDGLVTDPVWPNARVPLYGSDDPLGMFTAMWAALSELPKRAAVQLGCDSDPRFLSAVPAEIPFFRVASLELANPSHKGRLLMTGDTAYLFGKPPASRPGQHLIPGRVTDPDPFGKQSDHPCPRKIEHVKWLVHWWTEPTDLVADPFMGSGTTGVACAILGRRFTGVEVEKDYCDQAIARIKRAKGVPCDVPRFNRKPYADGPLLAIGETL